MKTITIANRDNAAFVVSGRTPLLDELRDQGVDLPYGCKYGGCITCAAKLLAGNIDPVSYTHLTLPTTPYV